VAQALLPVRFSLRKRTLKVAATLYLPLTLAFASAWRLAQNGFERIGRF